MGWKYYYYVVWESGNEAGGRVMSTDKRITKSAHIQALRDCVADVEKHDPLLILSFMFLERRWVWHE